MNNKKGFTFIEVLIVTAIIALSASAVIITVNPAQKFEEARDVQRQIHLQSILSAIEMRKTVERGWSSPCEDFPQELDENEQPVFKTIGTKADPGFYDIYKCLVPTYLNTELFDPLEGSKEDTKYQIWQNPYSKVITLAYAKGEKKITLGPDEYKILSIPSVTTAEVANITYTTADSGGDVTAEGDSAVFERGVVWAPSNGPTIYDSRTVDGSGLGVFTSSVTRLNTDVTYYLRAYARSDIGVAYGEENKFRTCSFESTAVETLEATGVTYDKATLLGDIVCVSADTPQRYFEWGKTGSYENEDKEAGVGGLGVFSFDLTGLEVNQTYYYRACAENNAGNFCGEQKSFFTHMEKPEVVTAEVTNIEYNSAYSGGNIIDNGGGAITKKGVCWSDYITEPTIEDNCTDDGMGSDPFVSFMTNLESATRYFVRAYATNEEGAGYGETYDFLTLGGLCQGIESGGDPGGTPLSCSIRQGGCLSGETSILRISDTDNAHAELPNRHLYNYHVCCQGNELGTACEGEYDTFLKLSSFTNAHVEKKSQQYYNTYSACLSTVYGAGARPSTISCSYVISPEGCSSLGSLYTCLASISDNTNAHIGNCNNSYPIRVCCANICP